MFCGFLKTERYLSVYGHMLSANIRQELFSILFCILQYSKIRHQGDAAAKHAFGSAAPTEFKRKPPPV